MRGIWPGTYGKEKDKSGEKKPRPKRIFARTVNGVLIVDSGACGFVTWGQAIVLTTTSSTGVCSRVYGLVYGLLGYQNLGRVQTVSACIVIIMISFPVSIFW